MQFRKTTTLGPFRFTLTQRGISVSAGEGPSGSVAPPTAPYGERCGCPVREFGTPK